MSKILYKLDSIISKIKYKLRNNSKINNILSSKITFFIILILFIILLWTYIYSINNHNWFQRLFNYYIFKLDKIELKILYILMMISIYLLYYIFKHFFINTINIAKNINKLIYTYILYIIIIFFFFSEKLETQILFIITPLIIYISYKIHLYINDTSEKYKINFLIDSRYLFLIALILLIYTPIHLYFENKELAEELSIYSYYFLVIWVFYEIIISKFKK